MTNLAACLGIAGFAYAVRCREAMIANLAACLGIAGFAYAVRCALHFDCSDIPLAERDTRAREIHQRIRRSHNLAHALVCGGARVAEPPPYFQAPHGWPL